MIRLAGDLLAYGIFAGLLTFVILYAFRSPWKETEMGRNIMAFMAVLMTLSGLGIVRRIAGDGWFDTHRDLLTLLTSLPVFIVVWWRNWILWKVQHEDRPREVKGEEDEHASI